jgi:hypothetical protein
MAQKRMQDFYATDKQRPEADNDTVVAGERYNLNIVLQH